MTNGVWPVAREKTEPPKFSFTDTNPQPLRSDPRSLIPDLRSPIPKNPYKLLRQP